MILERLSEEAALATLAKLAEANPTLARTSAAERIVLYQQTGGNPLLLRWTAGQIGRGSCLTFTDAIAFLRSCPEGNDPLEFIFGDLAEDFSQDETHVLCALIYFTLPAKVEHISQIAECTKADADRALRRLINRSLVVPSEELKTFTLVPLVADFLRKKKPKVVAKIGNRLVKRTYALVVENGYQNYDRFPVLDDAWPTVAAALPQFLRGPNERLQRLCGALAAFLNFTGRWDERLALSRDAESRALAAGDFSSAARQAYLTGFIHYLRGQSAEVLVCADRSEAHCREARASVRQLGFATRLRGLGYLLAEDYVAAVSAYREAVNLWRTAGYESEEVAIGLNSLAHAEKATGDLDSAESDLREALRIAQAAHYREGIANYTGNLAALALARENWPAAEGLALEALQLCQEIGRQELIASNCYRLAVALKRQGKKAEALPHARRAVEIFTRLKSPDVADARITLAECEA